MAKMMTKTQIAGHIASKFEITKKQSTEILMELATLAAKRSSTNFIADSNTSVSPGLSTMWPP